MTHLAVVIPPQDIRMQKIIQEFAERIEALKPKPDLPLPQEDEPE